MGALRDTVGRLYAKHGNRVHEEATNELVKAMREPGRDVAPIKVGDIRRGRFYFLMYDVSGKTTLMEKYSPAFVVDYKRVKGQVQVFAVVMNFIPVNVRVIFFDQVLSGYPVTVDANDSASSPSEEEPLANVDYEGAYKALSSVGFEYAIRQFDAKLINKAYEVSTGFLDRFLVANTARFTRVEEGKMVEIWAAKLRDQDARRARMMTKLYKDYEEMVKTIAESAKDIVDRAARTSREADRLSRIAGSA